MEKPVRFVLLAAVSCLFLSANTKREQKRSE